MKSPRLLAACFFTCLALPGLDAQRAPARHPPAASASAAAAPAAPAPADEEVVFLSPFEVSAGKDTGYMAAEAASGTRYAASVLEVPMSIQAITSEFIEDFLLLDINDVLAYTSGFVPTEGTGAMNLRGIRSYSGMYKNGIREGGIFGPVGVDRVEIMRGPNAAIYGATEPSGLRNTVTKNATPKPSQQFRFTAGTGDFYRATLSVNQPIDRRRLFTRFDFSTEQSRQSVSDFADFRRLNLYHATTWRIGPKTTFTYHFEYIKYRNATQAANGLPWVRSPVTLPDSDGTYKTITAYAGSFGSGIWERFQNLNTSGKGAFAAMNYAQIDANLTHQFARWCSLRILASRWWREQDLLNTNVSAGNTRTVVDPFTGARSTVTMRAPNGQPYGGYGSYIYDVTNGGTITAAGRLGGVFTPRLARNREVENDIQADLLFDFQTGPVRHKLLITADYSIHDVISRQKQTVARDPGDPAQLPGDPSNWTRWGAAIVLDEHFWGDWSFTDPGFDYDSDFFNESKWNFLTAWTSRQLINKGFMVSERFSLFDNRLIGFIGARHDEVKDTQIDRMSEKNFRDQVFAPGAMISYPTDSADTFQSGLLYKLRPALSLYFNASQSFNPNSRTDAWRRDQNKNPLKAERGQGIEIGIKSALFNERLNFTLNYYDIDKKNLALQARDEADLVITLDDGIGYAKSSNVISSRGFELDFNCRPSPALNLFGALSYNEIAYTRVDNPTEQYRLHVPPDSTPKWAGSLGANYSVTAGPLKGLSLRIGVRYMGAMIVTTGRYSVLGNSKIEAPSLTVGSRTYKQYYFENPAYTFVEGGIGYGWRTGKYSHSASLDVKNLLNLKYMRGSRPGDPMALFVNYGLRH
ncbi:MAG: TonB-dependent receptor [Opitutaceae bacterium]|jgi:outer membrane receptor protein involved in Fe transport|nr:TonB-dependent receptor [Opitutaceae bacterium]